MFSSRVQPSSTGARPPSVWSKSDRAALQRVLNPLHHQFRKQPAGFLKSEGSTMLSAPPDAVYERLVSFLSNVSIVSGLVLSAIASTALNPLRPEEFDKPLAAEAYNVIAAITVAVQLCVVLYSTFTLYILVSAAHSPTSVYKALTHMTRWLGFFEFMTFVPALLSFVMIVLACHLHCGRLAAYIVLGVVSAIVLTFQLGFNHMCMYAFPYNAWAWGSVFGGVYWLVPGFKAVAREQGELLLAQASEGVLAGLDEDGDYVIDDEVKPGGALAAGESELTEWVASSVESLSPTQRGLLVRGLLALGLTKSRMVEAAQHAGGYQSVCEMLANSELRMRPGERLALASAAMRATAAPTVVDVVAAT